jgi:hypothetical protein
MATGWLFSCTYAEARLLASELAILPGHSLQFAPAAGKVELVSCSRNCRILLAWYLPLGCRLRLFRAHHSLLRLCFTETGSILAVFCRDHGEVAMLTVTPSVFASSNNLFFHGLCRLKPGLWNFMQKQGILAVTATLNSFQAVIYRIYRIYELIKFCAAAACA